MTEIDTTVTDEQIEQFLAEHPHYREAGFVPSDPKARHAIVTQIRTAELEAKAVIPACPSWCTLGEGHKYDSINWEHDTLSRPHMSQRTPPAVCQWESNRNNVVTFDEAPYILSATGDEELDSGKTRASASELVAAAYLLDEITAGAK